MNKQNFESKDRFPLSTQSLSFMQEMIMATARLSLIGGNRYILSGCTETGKNVAPGLIVIDGEIMPFDGGIKGATITVIETPVSVSANGLTFENARITRKAIFATGTGTNYLPWTDFKPLPTNRQLEEVKATVKYVDDEIAKIQEGSIPKGVIVMWAGREADIPKEWCLCDGRTLPNNVRVPDLRGRFIVGYNPTSGSGYTTINAGARKPDEYNKSLTLDEMPSHNHGIGNPDGNVNRGQPGLIRKSWGDIGNTIRGADATIDEPDLVTSPSAIPFQGQGKPFDLRPPYYVLAFIIKI